MGSMQGDWVVEEQQQQQEQQEEELKACLQELYGVLREDPLNEEVQQVGLYVFMSFSLCVSCRCCLGGICMHDGYPLTHYTYVYICRYGIMCMNHWWK